MALVIGAAAIATVTAHSLLKSDKLKGSIVYQKMNHKTKVLIVTTIAAAILNNPDSRETLKSALIDFFNNSVGHVKELEFVVQRPTVVVRLRLAAWSSFRLKRAEYTK